MKENHNVNWKSILDRIKSWLDTTETGILKDSKEHKPEQGN